MAHQGKPSPQGPEPVSANPTTRSADPSQLDFELDFFSGVLTRHADYVDVLRIMGNLLALKGRTADGMQIDKRLVQLRRVLGDRVLAKQGWAKQGWPQRVVGHGDLRVF